MQLAAHVVGDTWEFLDEAFTRLVGVFHVHGGTVVAHGIGVELELELATRVKVLEVVVTLTRAEIGGITFGFFGGFPGIECQITRHFLFLADLPDLLHRAANELHQLIAKGKAETHSNE